ncbi:tetratricopeptide repeat domain protein [Penicillium herquei]|nr:tetratricopeptide repeat domain protein [Penicillium herquei]
MNLERHSYWGVFLIDARSERKILESLSKINKRLGLGRDDLSSIKEGLSSHDKPWLLVVDGAEHFGSVEKLLPMSDRGHILITTKGLNSSPPPHIPCEKMGSLCCAEELLVLGMNL